MKIWKKTHKIYASSTNYEKDFNKVLEDKTIDIVAIATQTSSHYYLIKNKHHWLLKMYMLKNLLLLLYKRYKRA